MNTQDTEADSIGRRIRAVRGDDSQAAFAKRVGITRAALANYETGRSKPKAATLRKIAAAGGVELDLLSNGFTTSIEELVDLLGLPKKTRDDLLGLSKDERAIIRVLRFCKWETSLEVVEALLAAIERKDVLKSMIDPSVVAEDISALMVIRDQNGMYEKPMVQDQLETLAEELARAVQSRERKDPQ